MSILQNRLAPVFFLFIIVLLSSSCKDRVDNESVSDVISSVITRIYDKGIEDDFDHINQGQVLELLSDKEKQVLGHAYWQFKIDQAADIFVCRDKEQEERPFWIEENGFEKTDYEVKNENVTYEVWKKRFPQGMVRLGINGFDRHRYVYFTLVKPVNSEDALLIEPIFPEKQESAILKKGTFIYHDWDELVVTDFSSELSGATLLHTIRGRSREAHLIDAFRRTKYPSTDTVDQIIQTWTESPIHTLTISWRTDKDIQKSKLKYWEKGTEDTIAATAEPQRLEDRLLANDRYINRYAAYLEDLNKGTTYQYVITTPSYQSAVYHFTTDGGGDEFAFGWFGDLHVDPEWGENIQKVDTLFDKIKFYISSGDLVNTGLYRDDWDELIHLSGPTFRNKPFMSAPGNHDSQEGLPPSRYMEYLKYPDNGPKDMKPGLTYHFTYGNTLFLMLDVVSYPVEIQKEWIEKQLQNADETFKIAVFHFPPFTPNERYDDIIENWVPLFEKYNVDLVLNGHFHYYLRMKARQQPLEQKNTPTYIMSVGTTHKNADGPRPKGPNVHFYKDHLFQKFNVSGKRLEMTAYDLEGNVIDQYVVDKS